VSAKKRDVPSAANSPIRFIRITAP